MTLEENLRIAQSKELKKISPTLFAGSESWLDGGYKSLMYEHGVVEESDAEQRDYETWRQSLGDID